MGTALPAIVMLRNGSAMVLLGVRPGRGGQPDVVVLLDPGGDEDAPLTLDEVRFTAAWSGEVVLIKRDYRLRDEDRPFGMGWIVGQLLRDRRMTRDLAICALLLSVLALAPIAFWRIMIDRVMHYGSLNTFTTLCIAFVVLVVFDTAFGHLRRQMALFLTTRADVKIWSHMFDRLLNLPIDFFERTPTGEIVHDMYEIYKVRAFLTNQMFGTLLELVRADRFSADHVPDQHDHDRGRADPLPADVSDRCRPPAGGPPQGRGGDAGRSGPGHDPRRGGARHADDQVAGAGCAAAASVRRQAREGGRAPVRRGNYDELDPNPDAPAGNGDAGRHRRGCGISGAHDQGPGLCRRDLRVHADVAAGRQADPAGGAIDRADRRSPPGDREMRRDRQPAARSRPLGARHPHPDRRPDRVQRRNLPLSGRGVAGARPGLLRDPRGQRVRDCRAQRIGQDDRDPAAAGTAQRLPRV